MCNYLSMDNINQLIITKFNLETDIDMQIK